MMQNKHAVFTGATTQSMKLPRICKKILTDGNDFRQNSQPNYESLSSKSSHRKNYSTSLAVRRSPVTILHVVSPGEFYIQLSKLSLCFEAFHLQIQEAQNEKYPILGTYLSSSGIENLDWSVNDHCLVYGTYGDSTTQQGIMGPTTDNEWYRGIIQDITFGHHHELQYSVFLRDIGATIKSGRNQLFSIDLQFDRVTNAGLCCHLSGIEPAGGNSWSLTSVDWFSDAINNFESLSVSMHNKRLDKQSSFPVVLWGSIIDTVSKFAPSITNYSNLNQDLVNSGLAYMAKDFDLTKQFDLVEEIAVSEGEITVEQWFQLFRRNDPLSGCIHATQQPEHLSNFTMDDDGFDGEIEGVADSHPLSVYLTEIDLTPTTGQSDPPPAWESSTDIFKTLFAGYPTYVDSNGIVHLHEANDKQFLETMPSIITKNHSEVPQTLSVCNHATQQPEHLSNFTMDDDEIGVAGSHPLSVYLTEIDLTPTTGQSNPPPAWKSSKDIFKTLFAGYPTYVDSNGIVYLHEADDKQLLETMSSIITKNHSEVPQTGTNYKFTIGQPVVARYIGDQKFYRGIIETAPNDEGDLTVLFIDYGNTHDVKPENIRPHAPFPSLPSIANKFQIRGIQPKNGAAGYTEDDLIKMHMHIVSKLLSVRVTDTSNTIKVCDMRLGNADVASTFIKQRLVDKAVECNSLLTSDDFEESETVYEVFVDNESDLTFSSCRTSTEDTIKSDCLDDLIDRLVQNADSKQLSPAKELTSRSVQHKSEATSSVALLEKRMRNDRNYMQYPNDIKATDSDIANLDHKIDMDMEKGEDDDIKQQIQTEAIFQEDENIVSQFDRFQPNYTSTPLLHAYASSVELFSTPQWPCGLTGIDCTVIYLFTPTVLIIFPTHLEFKQLRIELQRDIDHKVKTALPLVNYETGSVCLARSSKIKKWYRAIICSYNKIAKTVDVVYIDYMYYETLNWKYVRQCPSGVLDWPLCSFLVRLFGVEANPRIRDHVLRMALQKQLFERNLYAVIKKPATKEAFATPNNKNIMQISLYKSPEFVAKNKTAYETLIKKHYFHRT